MLRIAFHLQRSYPGLLPRYDAPERVEAWFSAEMRGWEARRGRRMFTPHHDFSGPREFFHFLHTKSRGLSEFGEAGLVYASFMPYPSDLLSEDGGMLMPTFGMAFCPFKGNFDADFEGSPIELATLLFKFVNNAPWRQGVHRAIDRALHYEAEASTREATHKAEREKVEGRAKKLLFEILSPSQKEDFEEHRSFIVRGKDGRDYLLVDRMVANVYLVEGGKLTKCFCAHPETWVPICDVLVAQKLMLESCPEQFFKIANEHPLNNPMARGDRDPANFTLRIREALETPPLIQEVVDATASTLVDMEVPVV
jgi:hypothetical protein